MRKVFGDELDEVGDSPLRSYSSSNCSRRSRGQFTRPRRSLCHHLPDPWPISCSTARSPPWSAPSSRTAATPNSSPPNAYGNGKKIRRIGRIKLIRLVFRNHRPAPSAAPSGAPHRQSGQNPGLPVLGLHPLPRVQRHFPDLKISPIRQISPISRIFPHPPPS